MKTLYYVADPMCSWCWGFQPVLEKVKEAVPEELSPVYIMGGLARDTDDPMPDAVRAHIQRAWREVAAINRCEFQLGLLGENCKPRRCTYPSCRAFYAGSKSGSGNCDVRRDSTRLLSGSTQPLRCRNSRRIGWWKSG